MLSVIGMLQINIYILILAESIHEVHFLIAKVLLVFSYSKSSVVIILKEEEGLSLIKLIYLMEIHSLNKFNLDV